MMDQQDKSSRKEKTSTKPREDQSGKNCSKDRGGKNTVESQQ